MKFLFVALGGAIGAVCRYAISMLPVKTQFPILTLIINLVGAIFIGFIVGLAESKKPSADLILFFKVGFCGGFTTFSTFSLEAYNLLNQKSYGLCAIYIFLSVIGCIAGVLVGKKIASIIGR